MFKKVLIANRGAIAVRIERTLKKMGIKSVAVYTKADQDSLHVEYADEAVLIGEDSVKDSYLNSELILKTALETGAEAIHPGYGFLSENAQFARECNENGITFIGPSPEQLELFGLKHLARVIAKKAKVPMLAGTSLIDDVQTVLHEAERIGYPVMLKSTAGGGGIGMKICKDSEELENAFEAVCSVAKNNFNNGGVFLEKYIIKARHVEIQIFGNSSGEVVTLGERDCSVQRRNQKVVEECPAPDLPQAVREEMLNAAKRLAGEAGYRSAGTVEFLYDVENKGFYFLEVNTRLQVEHGITEEVYGIDLVEWMVREAADELNGMHQLIKEPKGHSIEVRVYAEDCLNNFRPSIGKIDQVVFSDDARIETWLRDGLTVTSNYDPMLAKIIVNGETREKAVQKLKKVLEETKIYGVTTNLEYITNLLNKEEFKEGKLFTGILKDFLPTENSIEVLEGGLQTTVQDYPGRLGLWGVGVPPSGPMDMLSFRIGNKLLGNSNDAAGFELTLRGGSYFFRGDMYFCLTGSDMGATLDDIPVLMYKPIKAKAGQVLSFTESGQGMRTYLLVGGGFDMPKILGSASTFTLGNFGGHGGRALRAGDVISVNKALIIHESGELPEAYRPVIAKVWEIAVIPGPHCTEEFLMPDYLDELVKAEWEVHFNSSRTGVRLIGPTPHWARQDGGEAGLHPSNLHDNAYAIGTIDLTGDMPIFLGPDGPSLGGFVCPVTTPTAELWKLGQLSPGDKVKFRLITLEQAEELALQQEEILKMIESMNFGKIPSVSAIDYQFSNKYPILDRETENRRFPITIRCCGDSYLLIEYGEMEIDILYRIQVHALMQAIQEKKNIAVIDMTPGIRSLQIHIDTTKLNLKDACSRILELDRTLPPIDSMKIPSRIVRLPLSWNDPSVRLAMERYQQNVRPDAPWCPDNIEFIRRINGLDSIDDVKEIVFNAKYLVMGLGDVYLGAPVCIPLDPRQRLVTTKYNPARTWTPENAVGIGGAYMGIYGMEGPGGYQLFGRTIQMWNSLRSTKSFGEGKPWLLNLFDLIEFYPVSAEELLKLREDFLRGRFEVEVISTNFDVQEYLKYLDSIKDSTTAFKQKQKAFFQAEREDWKVKGLAEFIPEKLEVKHAEEETLPEGAIAVRSIMPGSVWKVLVDVNQKVVKDENIMIEESMKMEIAHASPVNGYVSSIMVQPGDSIQTGDVIAHIMVEQ